MPVKKQTKPRKEKDVKIDKAKFENVMQRLLKATPKPMPKRGASK